MKPQRIVILGGTGFVGRHLLPRLHADGHTLLALTRNRELHRELAVLPRLRLVNAQVHDPAVLERALCGADAVLNLVGILNESGGERHSFRGVHVDLTAKVIAACRAAGVARLLHMSALRAGEGTSRYLQTRGEAEMLVKQSGLAWTIYRPSVIFGPGDGLYFRFARLLRLAPLVPLARAGARFAPVYVRDVAAAIARSVCDATTAANAYEFGGPRVMTLAQIVRDCAQWLGIKRLVVPLPDFLGRLQALVFGALPGKLFTSDNYKSLLVDSVPTSDGLAALAIAATPVELIMPTLLAGLGKQARLTRWRQGY